MKKIIFIIVTSLFIFASCKKEKFPEIDDLTGNWIEQTSNSFKHKLIFEDETMYFFKPSSVDTLSYRLDKKQEVIYLRLKNNPAAGESNHKILINKKKKELTIWGLFIGVNTSETIFKKE
ncbi:MAG: hypothetical protein H0V01_02915 [Bacteroidetes bacterium]|nr:hypothetical protein [Bacteroidota bacterium]HET6243811.1 hypothetical protein [Bacteroidia bacterium]